MSPKLHFDFGKSDKHRKNDLKTKLLYDIEVLFFICISGALELSVMKLSIICHCGLVGNTLG